MKRIQQQAMLDIISVFEKSKGVIETIIDQLGFGVLVVDEEGQIYRANEIMAVWLGDSQESITGNNIERFLGKELASRVRWMLLQIKNDGREIQQLECCLPENMNTAARFLLLDCKMISGPLEKPLFVVSGSDVTEFKKAILREARLESALDIEKKKGLRLSLLSGFNELLDSETPVSLFSKILEPCLNEFGFEMAFFHRFDKIEKEFLREIEIGSVGGGSRAKAKSELPLNSNFSYSGKDLINFLNHSKVEWHVEINPGDDQHRKGTSVLILLEHDNVVLGVLELDSRQLIPKDDFALELLVDVAARLSSSLAQLELRKELVNKNQLLESSAKLRALGEMSAGISHEINNPLTIVYGKLKALHNSLQVGNVESEKVDLQVSQIVQSLDRISAVVKGLRVFAVSEPERRLKRLNLREIIENTLALYEQKCRESEVTLTFHSETNGEVLGNESKLAHMLINILNNSYDAIIEKSDRWIQIHLSATANQAVIEITDSGRGIPESIRQKIMQPFFTTKDPGKGTGLGLSVALGIIQSHQGDFYLNPMHENTQFVIKLPLVRDL